MKISKILSPLHCLLPIMGAGHDFALAAFFVMNTNEIWVDVVGSNGKYQVSLFGNLRGKMEFFLIPNPENKKTVNHKDSDMLNNNIKRLFFLSMSYFDFTPYRYDP